MAEAITPIIEISNETKSPNYILYAIGIIIAIVVIWFIYDYIRRTYAKTKGCGDTCESNYDCSETGIAGGPSVGADLLADKKFGCCGKYGIGIGRRCKGKLNILGKHVCPGPNKSGCDFIPITPIQPVEMKTFPTGYPCTATPQCSDTGIMNGPPADGTRFGCDKTRLVCCNRKDSNCAVIPLKDTAGLGGRCQLNRDCSESGYPGGNPSNGIDVVCRGGYCNKK